MVSYLQARRLQGVMDRGFFIHQCTELMSPPLVPEVKLHLAHEAIPIWQKTEEQLGEMGLPPPFWAFAWAGGQALARHILDHPDIVREKSVLDLASGSGLVGIAALKAGAKSMIAADIDAFSIEAIKINAAANDCEIEATSQDLLAGAPPQVDIILVGDLFYEKSLAARCLSFLKAARQSDMEVLIGDPGRSYLPKEQLIQVATYSVPVSRELEDSEIKKTAVWKLA
jgi:predicted nicotinamide N-methyase